MYTRVIEETSEDLVAGPGRMPFSPTSRTTRQPSRNRLIFLLSVRAGLRAKEIAGLTWSMVTDSNGAAATDIALMDKASKGCSGRTIPISKELGAAFEAWKADCKARNAKDHVISTERSEATSSQVLVNLFRAWYGRLGFPRMLESLRTPYLHHERGPQNFDSGRFIARRPGVGRSRNTGHHAALYRNKCRC